jgi:hypothetical protein
MAKENVHVIAVDVQQALLHLYYLLDQLLKEITFIQLDFLGKKCSYW